MPWEYIVMSAIQSVSRLGTVVMDPLFAFFTFLGEETFLLVAVFSIYWCGNKKFGEYLFLSLYSSIAANGILKDLVRRPRPFLTPGWEELRYVQIDNPLINTVSLGESFSFPSGHSQCAGGFFTAVALWVRKRWVTVLAVLAILAVMTSRVYLGVHFPGDVLVGAALGIIASLVSWWFFERYYHCKVALFACAVGISCVALLLSPSPDTVKTIGVGIGALGGMALEDRKVHFTTNGPVGGKVLRLVMGTAILMVIRAGLKLVLPDALIFDGLRYAVVGFAATGLWPWAFTALGL
ncbi:phosphatase PAP2 family protein [Angelakisella massiliensis]|uniref:phosphatase PAP2 family protein n=1 Tax=Angelakisella massiliensis TaxID=1871018 RepID=UPI0023A8730E|nr:phosphatase PAP2 family protein [Angelakisella massiliensis]